MPGMKKPAPGQKKAIAKAVKKSGMKPTHLPAPPKKKAR